MKRRKLVRIAAVHAATLVLTGLGADRARAAADASDTAADPVYDDGWQFGDNGGMGFGQWGLNIGSNTGAFTGSAPAIDTDGRSLGLYTESDGAAITASRFFDNGPLAVDETFGIDIARDPGGGEPAVWLQNGSGMARLRFFYSVSSDQYEIQDDAGFRGFGPVGSTQAIRVEISLEGPDSYRLALTQEGGPTETTSGSLMESGEIPLFILRAGGREAERREQFFNTITVPEPAAPICALSVLAALGALARRGRSMI